MSSEFYQWFQDLLLLKPYALIILGAGVVVLFLALLLIRPLNFWYWNINKRDELLEKLEKDVAELKNAQYAEREKQWTKTVEHTQCANRLEACKDGQRCLRNSVAAEIAVSKNEVPNRRDTNVCHESILKKEYTHTKGNDAKVILLEEAKVKEINKVDEKQIYLKAYNDKEDCIDKQGNIYDRKTLEKRIRF